MSSNPPPPNEAPKPVSNRKKGCSILSACLVLGALVVCAGAIATPKFLGFQCKSKQSEAKTNLMGLFTAEQAFFGEYETYTTDLVALNWTPDGSPTYAYGFSSPSTPESIEGIDDYDPTRRTTVDPRVVDAGKYKTKINLQGRAFEDADFQRDMPSATATATGFLAVAIGDIDTDGENKFDVWTIDHARELTAVWDECKGSGPTAR